MAKTSKPTSKPVEKNKQIADQQKIFNYNPKGIIKEGYQPTNTVDTSNPPKQNATEKKE